jgi:FkbM family methyltransferase
VFEPNPFFHKDYQNSSYILEKKAIWTENCTKTFHISPDARQASSSLFQDKLCRINGKLIPFDANAIQVDCIDFSEWLKQNVSPRQHVTLKLDIEGAEYDVLWKLINDKTIELVDKLYVEFHHTIMTDKTDCHNRLIEKLNSIGLPAGYWD